MKPELMFKTKVGGLEVSTVALPKALSGLYDTDEYGSSLDWETMIFDDRSGETDVKPHLTRRHTDMFEAKNWHDHCVEVLTRENREWEERFGK